MAVPERLTGSPSSSSAPPLGAETLLRRLPPGVNYSLIKAIIFDLPPPISTLFWTAESSDPIWTAFRTKTFQTVDRLLTKSEATLAAEHHAPVDAPERRRVAGLRYQWVVQVLDEILRRGPTAGPGLSLEPVDLRPRDSDGQPVEGTYWSLRITVRSGLHPNLRLVEQRIVTAGLPSERDPSPEASPADALTTPLTELFRRHFPDVLRQRPGSHWRTRRPPVGWQAITQVAVPRLFDLLKPHYPARRYRDHRQRQLAGHYPVRLRRDIRDLLRLERPDLAEHLTLERVTAAIQRYVATAPPDRLMGEDAFRVAQSRR